MTVRIGYPFAMQPIRHAQWLTLLLLFHLHFGARAVDSLAVAGFREEELDITQHASVLTVTGKAKAAEDGKTYLHRGIAGRAFQRRFELADFVRVTGAALENGLLHVELVREVPEAQRPRRIEIGQGNSPRLIGQAAA